MTRAGTAKASARVGAGAGAGAGGYALLLLLLLAGKEAGALRCWSCGSDTVPACRDPFERGDLQGPIACAGPPPAPGDMRPACTKAVLKLNEVETFTFRGCDWVHARGGGGVFCTHTTEVLGRHAEVRACTTCFGDACNATPPTPPPPPLLVLLLLLLLLPPLATLALLRQ